MHLPSPESFLVVLANPVPYLVCWKQPATRHGYHSTPGQTNRLRSSPVADACRWHRSVNVSTDHRNRHYIQFGETSPSLTGSIRPYLLSKPATSPRLRAHEPPRALPVQPIRVRSQTPTAQPRCLNQLPLQD